MTRFGWASERVGRWITACALGCIALGAADPAQAQERSPIARFQLANGLDVVLQEDHQQKLVALRMSYAVGSRNDPPGQSGLAHLVEHMTYRGSRHLRDGELWHQYQLAGAGDMSGTTGDDETVYAATIASSALELGLWLESERMAFGADGFEASHLEIERGVIAREQLLHRTDEAALDRGMAAAFFGATHPYARWLDFPSKRPSSSLEQARDFFLSGYRPDNARLILVGDFELAAARALVERYFSALRNPTRPKAVVAIPAKRARIFVKRVPAMDDRKILLAWNVPMSTPHDRVRFELLTHLLDEEFRATPASERRNLRRMVAGLRLRELGSLLTIEVTLEPGARPEDVERDLSLAQLNRGGSIGELSLENARRVQKLTWLSSYESRTQVADLQGQALELYGRPLEPNEYANELDKITLKELKDWVWKLDDFQATRVESTLDAEIAPP